MCFHSSPACYYAPNTRSFIHLTAPLHSAVWVKNSLPHSVPDQNYQTITLTQRKIVPLLLHHLTYVKTQHKGHDHKQYKPGHFYVLYLTESFAAHQSLERLPLLNIEQEINFKINVNKLINYPGSVFLYTTIRKCFPLNRYCISDQHSTLFSVIGHISEATRLTSSTSRKRI